MFSSRFSTRGVGRNTYYMYRTPPSNIGYNVGATSNPAPPPPPPDVSGGCAITATRERVLLCLHDDHNNEHVTFVKSVLRSDVHFQTLNLSAPIHRLHSELKLMLWRMFSTTACASSFTTAISAPRKLGFVGVLLYPLITFDEMECALNNVLPTLRGYYCFAPGQIRMPVTLFTLVPMDACFATKLAALEETVKATFKVVCLGGDACETSCNSCSSVRLELKHQFFVPNCTFEHAMDLTSLVEQLERKLVCLGNVKGLLVSNKMQNIFNRMLYIEDKYRRLQHNLMSETCHEGMLGEIEHIEAKIKDISMNIPLSYTDGHELIGKLMCSTQVSTATAPAPPCEPCGGATNRLMPAPADPQQPPPQQQRPYSYAMVRPNQAADEFHIPGRS